MSNTAQIVHESETQRQFVRLQLPATAEINSQKYSVKDLSSGGMALRNVENNFQKGNLIDLTLILPFSGFSLDVDLKAEILHIEKKTDIAGCRFVDLNAEQLSILNHVIKAYMAGDVVGGNDIINVVARENFVNVRKHPSNEDESSIDKIKKYGIYGLVALVTLILGIFIVGNILEKLFIIKSPQGTVEANTVEILSPNSGFFEMILPEGKMGVQKGQIIGTITASNNSGGGIAGETIETSVVSPCDCLIIAQHTLNGEYKPQNSKLFQLLPQESKIWVSVNMPVENVHRLKIDTRAVINISGTDAPYKGTIENIVTTDEKSGLEQTPTAKVTIQIDKKLPSDLIGRPAFVEFHL